MTESIPTFAELAARFVDKKITELRDYRNDADVRATLAKLRHGIGDVPGANPDIWAETLAELPEELLSKSNAPTAGELAIHTALTLFALHQQGSDIKTDCKHQDKYSLGRAIRNLADKKGEGGGDAIKRRFNTAVTSESIEEFSHHLRGLVQLLKAEGIALDYKQLTRELYWIQFPDMRDRLRLHWGQDYYRYSNVTSNEDA